jgi:hypothetical protein
MAKTKISEWSSTPANNTDIDSINIAEGCAPSGINDAIRELMSQVKDLYSGTTGDTISVAGGGTGAGTLTGILKGNGTSAFTAVTAPSGTIVGTTDTQTLTNKRIDPRNVVAASASTLTPDVSAGDQYAYTALAANLTINAPIGTPTDGDKLIFRLLDNGTARTLTWNATYTIIGVTLPTTTVINKTTYVGCIYNANNTRWDVVAVTTQA